MRKKVHNFIVTNVLADKTVIPDAIWLTDGVDCVYEKNCEIIDDFARQVDPRYAAEERAKRRFEKVESRRIQLEAERARIESELNKGI